MSVFTHYRRQWHPTPVLLPRKSHGWRSLVGCSPWDCEESDMTERLHFHFSLSCIGEGNGNPLQCSCLETPRDGRAWWADVYGVAHSWTQLKRLSSSSSSSNECLCSRKWQPTPVYLPGKFHGHGSLAGYSPWDLKELNTAEHACNDYLPFSVHQRYRQTFYSSSLYCTSQMLHFFFYKLKVCGNPASRKSSRAFFPKHVLISYLCVTFWLLLQYLKIFRH